MSRILEYGFGGFGQEPQKGTIDIHDSKIPLADRVMIFMLMGNDCCCDDFLCTDEELAVAISEIEGGDTIH